MEDYIKCEQTGGRSSRHFQTCLLLAIYYTQPIHAMHSCYC